MKFQLLSYFIIEILISRVLSFDRFIHRSLPQLKLRSQSSIRGWARTQQEPQGILKLIGSIFRRNKAVEVPEVKVTRSYVLI